MTLNSLDWIFKLVIFLDLKDKVESQMAEDCRISPIAMKLVFNGAILGPDTKSISEIENLANNSIVTLLKVQNIEVKDG